METATGPARRLLSAIRKFWLLIVAFGLLGGAGAFTAAALQTPEYESTATLYFALDQGTSASDLNQGSYYTQDQMLSFAQLAVSSRVLGPVVDELDLDLTPRQLARSIHVSVPPSTVIMRITATSTDPERAAAIANAVSETLSSEVPKVAPKSADGSAAISAQTIDEGVVPRFQSAPNKMRDALFGGLAGGLLGIAGAMVLSLFDNRVRNASILTDLIDAPFLGTVSRAPLLSRDGLGVAREPLGTTSEEFRRIGSALSYAGISSKIEKLIVTSGLPSEGKSTVAANLALTLSVRRGRVLLIDCDMRRPRTSALIGIDGSVGMTDVLAGDVSFSEAIYHVPGTSLDVLPAGGTAPNPAEILVSDAMASLLSEASAEYDLVVIDTPPVLNVADAILLAPMSDGVLVVVNAAKTRRAALLRTREMLSGSGARVVGTVLNMAKPARNQGAYYTSDHRRSSPGRRRSPSRFRHASARAPK